MITLARRLTRRTLLASVLLAIGALGGFVPLAGATPAANPVSEIRTVFATVLAELDARKADGTLDAEAARGVFAEHLSPRIAYDALARWILRDHWANASDSQRAAFLNAFQVYIINTYALALANGNAITLVVDDAAELKQRAAIVRAQFSVADADPVSLAFRLLADEDRWMLFDVSFAGVSLALTFRSDFNYVAKDGGIDAVTTHLNQRVGGLSNTH